MTMTATQVATKQIFILIEKEEDIDYELMKSTIQSKIESSDKVEGTFEMEVCLVDDINIQDEIELTRVIENTYDVVLISTNLNLPYMTSRLAFLHGTFIGSDGVNQEPLFSLIDSNTMDIIKVGNQEIF